MKTKTSAKLREELAAAEEQERAAAKAKEQQRRDRDRQLAALRKEATGAGEAVEQQVAEAIEFAEQNPPAPTRPQRYAARAFLRGLLTGPDELIGSEVVVSRGEPGLEALLGAFQVARSRTDRFASPMAGESFIGEGDPSLAKLRDAENRAWYEFVARVKAVAGEP
jgi:hypothetical protein